MEFAISIIFSSQVYLTELLHPSVTATLALFGGRKLFDLVLNKALKAWFAEARPLGATRDPYVTFNCSASI